jgi:hypothetical protein
VSVRRGSQSKGFNATVVGVCIAGIALVVGSVIGRSLNESAPYSALTSKKVRQATEKLKSLSQQKKPDTKKIEAAQKELLALQSDTHVHAAYGIFQCDKFIPPFNATALPDPKGIHAHEDGLLHIHPIVQNASGRRARLSLFFDAVRMSMSSSKIKWIKDGNGTTFNTLDVNKDKCGKKKEKAEISVWVWKNKDDKKPTVYTSDFGSLKLKGDAAYAFVFAPKGTKVPIPATINALATPSDVNNPATPTPSTVAGAASPTTVAGAASPTTVAGAASPTTVAGAATPTTAAGAAATTVAGATVTTTAGAATTVAAAVTTVAPTAAPAATTVATTAAAATTVATTAAKAPDTTAKAADTTVAK